MKLTSKLFGAVLLIGIFSGVAIADEEACPDGQVRQAFVDGTNTTSVCIDEPADVAANPEGSLEDDGFENPEGGGQEEE